MKIIGTTKISYQIEEILDNSNQMLVIVSPYLKINKRLKAKLNAAFEKVDLIVFIFREDKLLTRESNWLKSHSNVKLFPIENLHAKIYLNEETALITSMNLYEYSQINNHEIGVLINIDEDPIEFQETFSQIEHILASEEFKISIPHIFIPEEELTMSNLFKELNKDYTYKNYRPNSQYLYEYISEIALKCVKIEEFEMYQDQSAILRGVELGRERYALLKKKLIKYSNESKK